MDSRMVRSPFFTVWGVMPCSGCTPSGSSCAFGFVDAALHGAGDLVRVHDDPARQVAGGAAAGLDQGAGGAEEPLLVRIQDRHQGHLGDVEPLPEEVDADQDVEFPHPQVTDDLHPLDGIDIGMEVCHPHPQFPVVVGKFLGHPFGEGGDQHPLPLGHRLPDLVEQIVNLAGSGAHLDFRIHQPGGSDHLLHHHPFGLLSS